MRAALGRGASVPRHALPPPPPPPPHGGGHGRTTHEHAQPTYRQGCVAMLLCDVTLGRQGVVAPGQRRPPPGFHSGSSTGIHAVYLNDQVRAGWLSGCLAVLAIILSMSSPA